MEDPISPARRTLLKAGANDAVPRGRPQKHENKPEAATQAENSCLGHKT
jgi:hypothetical protein